MKIRHRTHKTIHQFFSLQQNEQKRRRALEFTSEPNHTSIKTFDDMLARDVDELDDENFDFLFKFAEYHVAKAKRRQMEAKMHFMLAEDIYDDGEFPIRELKLNDRLNSARMLMENANAQRAQSGRWLADVWFKANKRKVPVLKVGNNKEQ